MSSILENTALVGSAWHHGIQLCNNLNLTKEKKVRKNFHEQFLTWPWKPWKFFKTIQIPDPDCYFMNYQGQKVLVGHPNTINPIIEDLNRYLKEKE